MPAPAISPGLPTEALAIKLQEYYVHKHIHEFDEGIKPHKNRFPAKALNHFMMHKLWHSQHARKIYPKGESTPEVTLRWDAELSHVKEHYLSLVEATGTKYHQMKAEYDLKNHDESSKSPMPATSTTVHAASGSFAATKSSAKRKVSCSRYRATQSSKSLTTPIDV